jgi:hypothetical protein
VLLVAELSKEGIGASACRKTSETLGASSIEYRAGPAKAVRPIFCEHPFRVV